MVEKKGIIVYHKDNFDPTRIKKTLGLEQDIEPHEKRRLANLLWRTGNLSDEEVEKLGMVVRKVDSEETFLKNDIMTELESQKRIEIMNTAIKVATRWAERAAEEFFENRDFEKLVLDMNETSKKTAEAGHQLTPQIISKYFVERLEDIKDGEALGILDICEELGKEPLPNCFGPRVEAASALSQFIEAGE